MKKCPHCNAPIEENAKICLYCMTELEPKAVITVKNPQSHRFWLIALAVVLVAVLLVSSFWMILNRDDSSGNGNGGLTADNGSYQSDIISSFGSASESSSDLVSSAESQASSGTGSSGFLSGNDTSNAGGTSSTAHGASGTEDNTPPVSSVQQGTTPSSTVASSSNSSEGSIASTSSETSTSSNDSSTSGGSYWVSAEEAAFIANPIPQGKAYAECEVEYIGGSLAITNVKSVGDDGVCYIPPYVNGELVTMINRNAFLKTSGVAQKIKVVVLPTTVSSVWSTAFSGCVNMSDLYVRRQSTVNFEPYVISNMVSYIDNVTLHTFPDCKTSAGSYYKENYNETYHFAKWEEWDGNIDF